MSFVLRQIVGVPVPEYRWRREVVWLLPDIALVLGYDENTLIRTLFFNKDEIVTISDLDISEFAKENGVDPGGCHLDLVYPLGVLALIGELGETIEKGRRAWWALALVRRFVATRQRPWSVRGIDGAQGIYDIDTELESTPVEEQRRIMAENGEYENQMRLLGHVADLDLIAQYFKPIQPETLYFTNGRFLAYPIIYPNLYSRGRLLQCNLARLKGVERLEEADVDLAERVFFKDLQVIKKEFNHGIGEIAANIVIPFDVLPLIP